MESGLVFVFETQWVADDVALALALQADEISDVFWLSERGQSTYRAWPHRLAAAFRRATRATPPIWTPRDLL